jgi:hypothetical protein
MARFGGGRWDYNDNEEEGEYKASLSQTVLILVATLRRGRAFCRPGSSATQPGR